MSIALITGSCGLVGQEASCFFSKKGFEIIGIDNDRRKFFFGNAASTFLNIEKLKKNISDYKHYYIDITDYEAVEKIFLKYKKNIALIIHAAAQPSHDWAKDKPLVDFKINANGTLNLLDLTKKYCSDAVFIFMSTNKVYGDTPNKLPLIELESRFEISNNHKYYDGIDENMSIDNSTHSLFGASKVAADILVQEYGRYFGIKTVAFRAGCLSGSLQNSVKLHGFLSYVIKCGLLEIPYSIIGYKGKQVRDNIHSFDLVNAFWLFFKKPKIGQTYNIGGGRSNSISILEIVKYIENMIQKQMNISYEQDNRKGDHIWWITNFSKFKLDYPSFSIKYDLKDIIEEIYQRQKKELKLEII